MVGGNQTETAQPAGWKRYPTQHLFFFFGLLLLEFFLYNSLETEGGFSGSRKGVRTSSRLTLE